MPSDAEPVGCRKLLLSDGKTALSRPPVDCMPFESSGETCPVRCPAAKPTLGSVNWNLVPESVVLVIVCGILYGVVEDERA